MAAITATSAAFAGVNALKNNVGSLLNIMKRCHQQNLNNIQWKQAYDDCKNMNELLDTIRTEPEQIREDSDKALFKSCMQSTASRLENAEKLVMEISKNKQLPPDREHDTNADQASSKHTDKKSSCNTLNYTKNTKSRNYTHEEIKSNLRELQIEEKQEKIQKNEITQNEKKNQNENEPTNQQRAQHQNIRNNSSSDNDDRSNSNGRLCCCGLGNILPNLSMLRSRGSRPLVSDTPGGSDEYPQHRNKEQTIIPQTKVTNTINKTNMTTTNISQNKIRKIMDTSTVDRDEKTLQQICNFIKEVTIDLHKAIEVLKKCNLFKSHVAKPSHSRNYYLDFDRPDSHEGMVKAELVKYIKSWKDCYEISISENRYTDRDEKKENEVWSLAIWGNGGMGKSVTLQALCSDEDMNQHFKDGIHFIVLGENAKPVDVIYQLGQVAGNAGYKEEKNETDDLASRSDSNALKEAAQKCREALRKKRILLVVDDVWEKHAHQRSFMREIKSILSEKAGGVIVFSTRDEKIAQNGTRRIQFEYLDATGDIASKILEAHLHVDQGVQEQVSHDTEELEDISEDAKRAKDNLLKICGGLKLCLAIAGRGLRNEIEIMKRNNKQKMKKRYILNDVLIVYTHNLEKTMRMCKKKTPDYVNLIGVAQSSIEGCRYWASTNGLEELCDGEMSIEDMYYSLCTVEKQRSMPYSEVMRLWRLEGENRIEEEDYERVLRQFERMNLISVVEKEEEECDVEECEEQYGARSIKMKRRMEVRLHDRMIDVCIMLGKKKGKKNDGVEKWHKKLLNSYIESNRNESGSARRPLSSSDVNTNVENEKCRGWWDEKKAKGEYIMKNLGRHLVEGGMWEELMWLVSDVRWTIRRRREEGGWKRLDSDFEMLLEKMREAGDSRNKRLEDVKEEKYGIRELREVLRSSWPAIYESEYQVGFEVFGRVSMEVRKNNVISCYLESVEKYSVRPWLRPTWPLLGKKDGRERLSATTPGGVYGIYWSETDDIIGVGYSGSRMYVMDVLKQEHREIKVRARPTCVDFSIVSNLVVAGFGNGNIEVWDVESGEMIGNAMTGHDWGVECVRFSMDGTRVVSGSRDRSVRVWDVESGEMIGNAMRANGDVVRCVSFSIDGRRVVSGSDDKIVRVWDVESGKMIGNGMRGHDDWVKCVSFSTDGRRVVSGSTDESVRVWDVESGEMIGNGMRGHKARVECVTFSMDGMRVVSGSLDERVQVWDVESGEIIGNAMTGHGGGVECVRFSMDGTRVVSGSRDRSVRVWDVESGEMIGNAIGTDGDVVRCVSFSMDGTRVVSGSDDKIVRVWDVESGKMIGNGMRGHDDRVESVHFSMDGSRVVSRSRDESVRVWDVESGEMIGNAMRGHDGPVECVSFSMDGRRVVSGSRYGIVGVWDVGSSTQIGSSLYLFLARVNRYYEMWIEELMQEIWRDYSTATHHLCPHVLHNEMIATLQEMGYNEIHLNLDECEARSCCVEETKNPTTYKLNVEGSRVYVRIDGDNVQLAGSDKSCSLIAVSGNTVVVGFRDGRVLISHLQE